MGGHLAQDLHVLDEVQLQAALLQAVLPAGGHWDVISDRHLAAVRSRGEERCLPRSRTGPGPGGRAGHSLGPDDGVVKLGVNGFQVLQRGPLVQHPLVEG